MRLATGIDIETLQKQIDDLEELAIKKRPFTPDQKEFLREFYTALGKGARLSLVLGESGRLMDHYLYGAGQDFELDPSIFQGNSKVEAEMDRLRQRLQKKGREFDGILKSPTFYMPDSSNWDSVFGLYYGSVAVRRVAQNDRTFLEWRAEVPWVWPSYESLKQKYGSYDAGSFPLPNPISLVSGEQHALTVDNGLGEYLTHLDLAKTFVAFATWREPLQNGPTNP